MVVILTVLVIVHLDNIVILILAFVFLLQVTLALPQVMPALLLREILVG